MIEYDQQVKLIEKEKYRIEAEKRELDESAQDIKRLKVSIS